jgi:hypothetical protein
MAAASQGSVFAARILCLILSRDLTVLPLRLKRISVLPDLRNIKKVIVCQKRLCDKTDFALDPTQRVNQQSL